MRVAVVSDIHANLPALEAVARDLDEQGVDDVWCLGDVVGYGAEPREALEWVEKRASIIVKGNHDEAVAAGDVEGFNPIAAAAARYHAQILTPPERSRLHELPLIARRELGGVEALLVHGSPDDPLREYVYPTAAAHDLARWRGAAGILLLGHTHVPFLAETSRDAAAAWTGEGFAQRTFVPSPTDNARAPLLIVNPGSVGQPRDADPRACYAIVDDARRVVELRRVEYDVDAEARAIRAARLDPFLAQRLYRGA